MSTPNPQSRPGGQRPIQIQPSQANQLVQALKNEVTLAKAAGNDTAKAQQHYAKAESIKQVLLNYQAQQKAKMSQQQGQLQPQQQQPQPGMSQPQSQNPSFQQPQMQPGNRPASAQPMGQLQQLDSMNQPSPMMNPGMNRLASPGSQGGLPQQPMRQTPPSSNGTPSLPMNAITVENFNQVKTRLGEFERKIQQLQNSKKSYNLNPEQISAIESQLTELKNKYTKYQKFAYYMKAQLVEQAKNMSSQNNAGTPGNTGSIGPAATSSAPPPGGQGSSSGAITSTNNTIGTPSASTPSTIQNKQQDAKANLNATAQPQTQPDRTGRSMSPSNSGANTPGKSSTSATSGMPSMNLSGITKPSVPSIPISSSINVKPPASVSIKPNNISRPTLSGGVANGMGQVLGTPAILKLPSYDLASTGGGNTMPDNGGRVLTKRKLNELVNTIGADEGDGKTVIDGDVEELLLDLADEFISSVTGFACRLAKHRKVETIDTRDVQLHLEKNWNIRIPGYSMDEIRSTRKLQPSSSYLQKLSGVEISKSVNGDIN